MNTIPTWVQWIQVFVPMVSLIFTACGLLVAAYQYRKNSALTRADKMMQIDLMFKNDVINEIKDLLVEYPELELYQQSVIDSVNSYFRLNVWASPNKKERKDSVSYKYIARCLMFSPYSKWKDIFHRTGVNPTIFDGKQLRDDKIQLFNRIALISERITTFSTICLQYKMAKEKLAYLLWGTSFFWCVEFLSCHMHHDYVRDAPNLFDTKYDNSIALYDIWRKRWYERQIESDTSFAKRDRWHSRDFLKEKKRRKRNMKFDIEK